MSQTGKEQVKSVVRHLVTSIGAILVADGHVSASMFEEISGISVAAAGLIWAIWSKKNPKN